MNHKYRGYDIIKLEHRLSPYTGKPVWKIPADEEILAGVHDTLAEARERIDRMIKSDAEFEAQVPRILDGLRRLVRRA